MIGVLVVVIYKPYDEASCITSQTLNFQSMAGVQDFKEALDKSYPDTHDYEVRVTVFGGVV